jgi:predicted transcriptional regulator
MPESKARTEVIRGRVDGDTRRRWQALAKANGRSEGALLRQLIATVLDKNKAAAEAVQGGVVATKELRLRLRDHESDAVAAAAQRLGMKPNAWVVSLIRGQLFREPRPTDAEVLALRRSTDALSAIGRNLNQIAHAMHRGDRSKGNAALRQLDELQAMLTSHIERETAVRECAVNRWSPTL